MSGRTIVKGMQKMIDIACKTRKFDRVLSKVKVVDGSPGRCICELKVDEEHLNFGNTLHGGLTATMVDMLSTIALMSNESGPSGGVSVDLNVSYLKAAKVGEVILIDSNTVRVGKTLAFLSVDIISKDTGHVIAHGRHTKFVGEK